MSSVIQVSQVYYPESDGKPEPIQLEDGGFLDSRVLELRLRIGDGHLDFVRWDTGERLLTRAERVEREAEARQREAERADRETQARQREREGRLAAEAEVARLRGELACRGAPTER